MTNRHTGKYNMAIAVNNILDNNEALWSKTPGFTGRKKSFEGLLYYLGNLKQAGQTDVSEISQRETENAFHILDTVLKALDALVGHYQNSNPGFFKQYTSARHSHIDIPEVNLHNPVSYALN